MAVYVVVLKNGKVRKTESLFRALRNTCSQNSNDGKK